jgi:dTDP-4-dehydrorhamnose reductase
VKLLVTGREGQVVASLIERGALRDGVEIVAAGRPDLDLRDTASIERTISVIAPDVVVSAAAYTAVDQAEDEPELAFAINETGARAVAAAAARIGAPIIHLSTDYVFSGGGDHPHDEDGPTDPGSVYGRSKLAGERAVTETNPRHVILRTAWVYSPFGKNFVKTMLRLASERDVVRVVADQWGNPTSAFDIADGVLDVATRLLLQARSAADMSQSLNRLNDDDLSALFGVFHMVGSGETNWADFARHIFFCSRAAGGPFAEVESIPTSAYPTKASRPVNSRLSGEKLAAAYGVRLPDWRASTKAVVERLIASEPS